MLLLIRPAVAGDDSKQPQTVEFLRNAVVTRQKNMFSDDAKVRLATVDAMWPSAKDMRILFPKHAEKLGRIFDASKNLLKKRIESTTAEELARQRERRGSIRRVKTIDVRVDDASRRHQKVLKIIPKNVPVYRIVIAYEKTTAGSSSYLYLNGRWVHFQRFSEIPEILPRLDELLKRIPNGK
jgi:hypothetical protein